MTCTDRPILLTLAPIHRRFSVFRLALWTALAGVCATLAQVPGVPRFVSPNPVAEAEVPWISLPPDELTPNKIVHSRTMEAAEDTVDWSVDVTKAPAAWADGWTGDGVTVAVLDTGVMAGHKDLKEGILKAKDFTNSASGTDDRVGHGTHCAGSIGARKNGWGLVGQAYNCKLLIAKVLNDQGSGAVNWIAAGMDWATDEGADVQSLSLGGSARDTFIPPAILRARAKGVIVIIAAGNDSGGPVSYPGAYPGCFAVSAIDKNKRLAGFSNVGVEMRVTGPGVNVRSCYPGAGDGLFADLSGTSMATPNVAGVAALWVQADKKAGGEKVTRPERFEAWLKATAEDLGVVGRDVQFGYGLPRADRIKGGPVDPPLPPPVGGGVTIGLSDLTEAAKKRLADAGVTDWSTTIRVSPGTGGAATAVTLEQVAALATVGPVTVYHGVPPVPGAFLLSDPPPGLKPGVYEVEKAETLKFHEKQ